MLTVNLLSVVGKKNTNSQKTEKRKSGLPSFAFIYGIEKDAYNKKV